MKHVVTELFNHNVAVEHGEVIDTAATAEARMTDMNAPEVKVPIWTVVLTDRDNGDQIRLALARKGRDGLVKDLTGGIVLAGGQLPNL